MLTLRVDDRLIHTQIVAGWIQALALEHIIVANDSAADNPLSALAMELALPPGVTFCVCRLVEVALHVRPGRRQIVIVGSVACAERVIAHLPAIREINLANCARHLRREETQQFNDSVWLTKQELKHLAALSAAGINIVSHSVPPVVRT